MLFAFCSAVNSHRCLSDGCFFHPQHACVCGVCVRVCGFEANDFVLVALQGRETPNIDPRDLRHPPPGAVGMAGGLEASPGASLGDFSLNVFFVVGFFRLLLLLTFF